MITNTQVTSIFFSVLLISQYALADEHEGICAYAISGGYGPISRYLYYLLLLISIVFHRIEWLVAGTLGASMLFSSVAAIHAVAIAAARGRATFDLDAIPVFAITGVGLVAASPTMVWSNTIRWGKFSTRLILVLWTLLMFVGVLASMATLKTIPKPVTCPQPLGCETLCNVTLPIRRGQALSFVNFPWRDKLFHCSGWYVFLGATFSLLGIILGVGRQTPQEQARAMLRNRTMTKRGRQREAGRILACAYLTPWTCGALIISMIVLSEIVMMKPRHVPHSEDLSAIGQWGSLVGASLAFLASLLKFYVDRSSKAMDVQADVENPLQPDPNSILRFKLSTAFRDGTFWGHALNGLKVIHQGVEWVVREGVLRRPTEDNREEPVGEMGVILSRRKTF
ncbi:MAG: hypothetical protein M1816_000773 [Peltula sp. TS41687]|nr:MAG: hypothetical protein M1816_000773 [Peltula sp. TS41687]